MGKMRRLLNIKEISIIGVIAIIFSSIIFGALVSLFVVRYSLDSYPLGLGAIRENDKTTPLIRPLLAYNTPESNTPSPLKDELKKIVDREIRNKQITVASVYYRDLNTGMWFGINQDETFLPASLFKVPIMIAYLKEAGSHPSILLNEITNNLVRDENEKETIKALKSVTPGQTYTVEQLLHYMIEYSDNNATTLLFKYLDKDTLQKVFYDLDIQLPTADASKNFISVGNYSFFFRILYNATYLNHAMSEKGLEMLSKADFQDGIRREIPSGVPIADKFGEYFLIGDDKKERQLHDCGIVYHPKHPYLLCVMTKGDSFDKLKLTIQQISKATYAIVNNL